MGDMAAHVAAPTAGKGERGGRRKFFDQGRHLGGAVFCAHPCPWNWVWKTPCARFLREVTYNQMVVHELSELEIDRIFQALADATRRDIIKQAMRREQSVSELAKHYRMSFAAVQKHVAVLEKASLITKEKRGREQIVHGNPEMLHRAAQLLDAYEDIWRQRANRIGEILLEPRKGTES
ncbi:DNA-binding transcriptional ArsR family regulator [Paeniglutamicibacter kerguelensis]|uniref:DNA-binding transcriptional ArsR family regulator n=2 Tax=Paeniglutamicibacter kerguelensis TaxID=254788 RepID=A0ABS4XJ95_9MICC|nr:DNA-binding transcriptional ArsR family regulator [Paeniglutamicibacter kerguelensis]